MKLPDINENGTEAGSAAVNVVEQPATERLRLPASMRDEIIDHALQDLPNEACGLIAFDGPLPVKVFYGTNVLASPTRYRMADAEVVQAIEEMEQNGWSLGAIYHSHPSSPAVPSDTDLDEANWPAALMVIVSLVGDEPDFRAFRIAREREDVSEVELELLEPEAELRSQTPLLERVRRMWSRIVPTQAQSDSNPVASGAQAVSEIETSQRAVVGILGGMGPAATGDLYLKIIAETPADTDQAHIPTVIYADPRVPDRTEALLNGGADPVPWLVRGARKLEALDVSFIVIPCNTAHAYLDQVEAEVDTPFLSMLETAAEAITSGYPGVRRVGLLATTGTIQSGIYQDALRRRGLEVIAPDDALMEHCVMPAIRAIKANNYHDSVRSRLVEAADYLERRGAHAVLAACTEIPIVLTADDINLPLIDATEELARATVREALDRDARNAAHPLTVSGDRKSPSS